jgi:hypothetical protein
LGDGPSRSVAQALARNFPAKVADTC